MLVQGQPLGLDSIQTLILVCRCKLALRVVLKLSDDVSLDDVFHKSHMRGVMAKRNHLHRQHQGCFNHRSCPRGPVDEDAG